MLESAKVGMDIINDIRALQEPNALETAVKLGYRLYYAYARATRTMQQKSPI